MTKSYNRDLRVETKYLHTQSTKSKHTLPTNEKNFSFELVMGLLFFASSYY